MMGAGRRECLITVGAEPETDMGEFIALGALPQDGGFNALARPASGWCPHAAMMALRSVDVALEPAE